MAFRLLLFCTAHVLLDGLAAATNAEGTAYLSENKKKAGVVVLPSGLQYEVLKSGGGAKPESTSDSCTCHYTGKLIDGTVFDSSVQRGKPATFSPSGVIAGWTEALMLMRPGDKWILTIPSELAYGDRGSGAKIPGGSALIFELELISVKAASWQDWLTPTTGLMACFLLYQLYSLFGGGSDPEAKAFGEKFLAENKLKEGVVTLASGLQYKVLRAGDGGSHPLPSSPCLCHYEGRCAKDWPSGKKFDSSYDRGSPTAFAPNQVIRGWTEAMQLMVEGDKWEMYIPSNLAYGDSGRVAGCLVFTMEIIKIQGGSKPKVKKDD
jgi:FKBP-type peptidyl-prolyl cis-trans isomerase